MQKVTRDALVDKAVSLLKEGRVSCVLGWEKGEFGYDAAPAVFTDVEKLREGFVWDCFAAQNLSKYIVKIKGGKLLVFLRPCDTLSFNTLLTEHRIRREDVYVIGVPCEGTVDMAKLRAIAGEGITSAIEAGEMIEVHTLYADAPVNVNKKDVIAERCLNCRGGRHAAYDELLGEEGEDNVTDRFAEVERLEGMTADERYAFWQKELSRCIRCNACRDVCPACTCEKCVFDNAASGVESKAPDSFEEKIFHILRAYHVAGRCTDCGECSRVCPENIPLHLLNRKFIKDINLFYGEYRAGETAGMRAPLTDHKKDDIEPAEAFQRRGGHA